MMFDGQPEISYAGIPVLITKRANVLHGIDCERDSQDEKWGVQDHDDTIWMTILAEEIGEAAQEVLQRRFGDEAKGHGDLRSELVQIAAVATAWIECIDRDDE